VTNLIRRELLKSLGFSAALYALPFGAGSAGAADSSVKIGIIGSGHVGSALGRVWANAGHPVMFSSQKIDHDRELASQVGPNARAGTPSEAAAFGDVLLVAVPYGAMPDLGKTLAGALKGKVVIDASNPFASRDGAIAERATREGAGLVTAQLLAGAFIVRAFNAVGSASMADAHNNAGHFGMPIAADYHNAIDVASRLIREIGYEPVLVGGLAMGKYLVPGTPLAGEHTPQEIRSIVATLHP
jgi:8-hydroxy-5-deazaflavin:NADPH oxidoreductase